MDRRSFFKAIGAVAAACGLPVKAATPTATLGAAMKPGYPWTWMLSLDGGYTFDDHMGFTSKDEALTMMSGLADYDRDDAVIAECKQQDFDLRINFDWLLDYLRDQNDDLIGEGDFISVSDEQGEELEREINAVIEEWATRHNLYRTAWTFAGTRNHVRAADLATRAGESARGKATP